MILGSAVPPVPIFKLEDGKWKSSKVGFDFANGATSFTIASVQA